jgi:hypothetical protein
MVNLCSPQSPLETQKPQNPSKGAYLALSVTRRRGHSKDQMLHDQVGGTRAMPGGLRPFLTERACQQSMPASPIVLARPAVPLKAAQGESAASRSRRPEGLLRQVLRILHGLLAGFGPYVSVLL